jgi:cytochrome c556
VTANDKGAIARSFKALGDSCKGCHDRYRKDDKK